MSFITLNMEISAYQAATTPVAADYPILSAIATAREVALSVVVTEVAYDQFITIDKIAKIEAAKSKGLNIIKGAKTVEELNEAQSTTITAIEII